MTASRKPWLPTKTSKAIRIDAESALQDRRLVGHFVDVMRDNIDAEVYFWLDQHSDYDPVYILSNTSIKWDGYLVENGRNYDTSPLFCLRDRLLIMDTKRNPNVFVIKSK